MGSIKMFAEDLKKNAIRLIPGLESAKDIMIESLKGGANNRIFKITTTCEKYIVKQYFRHKEDQRNRLESEYLFASFAWDHGIRCIAEPIAKDNALSIGIYRFIEGEGYRSGDIGDKEVSSAALFLKDVNQYKSSPDAIGLPVVSEACFSIEEHMRLVDLRIERLKSIEVVDDLDNEALAFVKKELAVAWSATKAVIMSKAATRGTVPAEKISPDDTIISPSDFGFHNAISGNDGVTRFVDFEYAGWDDPAKTVGDFFSQVAVPVPLAFFDRFVNSMLTYIADAEETMFRIKLLLPLYRVKWCCIVLNHFLCVDRERKEFAIKDAMGKKYEQLKKARGLLDSISETQL